MSDELTTAQREWMLNEAERHMRDYAARGVSNNAATVLLEEHDRMRTELNAQAPVVRAARTFVAHRWTGLRVPEDRFLQRDAELIHAISEAIDELDRETGVEE